jgi:hypothetical protein
VYCGANYDVDIVGDIPVTEPPREVKLDCNEMCEDVSGVDGQCKGNARRSKKMEL